MPDMEDNHTVPFELNGRTHVAIIDGAHPWPRTRVAVGYVLVNRSPTSYVVGLNLDSSTYDYTAYPIDENA